MPDTGTVDLAGKPYPKTIVWGVLAAAGAILGYAWFTRNQGVDVETDYLVPEEVEPTGTLPFGGTQSGTFTEGPVAFRSDQEWYKEAKDVLLFDYGATDTPTVANVLDRYLAGQTLNATQVPMINFVINSIGPPPSGARPIRQETTTTPPTNAPGKPATPTGLVLSIMAPNRVRADWSPVSGATSYEVNLIAGVGTVIQRDRVTAPSWASRVTLKRKSPYRVRVWAIANNVLSEVPATNVIHTN